MPSGAVPDPAGPTRRLPGPPVLAGAGGAAALLALGTLGLTWVRREVDGPLGEAVAAGDVVTVPGREAAPLVAALVPALAALLVVAVLLRGRGRLVGLLPAVLVALVAAAAALVVTGDDGATAVPWLTAGLCLLAAGVAAAAVVGASRERRRSPAAAPAGPSAAGAAGGGAAGATSASAPVSERELWDAVDEGRDPTA